MIQEILVGLIFLFIVFLAGRKLYRIIRYPEQSNPCAHCSASCTLRNNPQRTKCKTTQDEEKSKFKQEK